jgi:aldehyde dehydrogenase (NAD+)
MSGQACTATSRLVVMRAIGEELVKRVVRLASQLRVGNGLDPDVIAGPLASAEQERDVLAAVERAVREGCTLLTGGERPNGPEYEHGWFVSPAVLACADPQAWIAQQEIFGPVLVVLVADSFDDVVRIVNTTPYGLVAGVCTRDIGRAHAFWSLADAGVIKVNRGTTQNLPNVPFGGVRRSADGATKEFGMDAVEFFSRSKTVYLGH